VAPTDPDSPGRFGAATCGGQTSTGLTAPTGLEGLGPPSPWVGVRCRHVLPPRQEWDWPCHVLMAEGPSRDSSPTTAFNAVGGLGVPKSKVCLPLTHGPGRLTPR
jgi:hypothetical protein